MNRFQYPVLLTPAEEGGYVVTCRDLPQLITQGDTEQDALEQAADAMDEVFATYMVEGMEFPEPSKAKRREHLVAPPADAAPSDPAAPPFVPPVAEPATDDRPARLN